MDFAAHDHIFRVVPPVLGNEDAEAPAILLVKVVTMPEWDKSILETAAATADKTEDAAREIRTQKALDMAKSHFSGAENFTVGGEEIKTFDDFYAKAPREMVAWYLMAIYSTQILSDAEAKN